MIYKKTILSYNVVIFSLLVLSGCNAVFDSTGSFTPISSSSPNPGATPVGLDLSLQASISPENNQIQNGDYSLANPISIILPDSIIINSGDLSSMSVTLSLDNVFCYYTYQFMEEPLVMDQNISDKDKEQIIQPIGPALPTIPKVVVLDYCTDSSYTSGSSVSVSNLQLSVDDDSDASVSAVFQLN